MHSNGCPACTPMGVLHALQWVSCMHSNGCPAVEMDHTNRRLASDMDPPRCVKHEAFQWHVEDVLLSGRHTLTLQHTARHLGVDQYFEVWIWDDFAPLHASVSTGKVWIWDDFAPLHASVSTGTRIGPVLGLMMAL